jgi:hypothetical protein
MGHDGRPESEAAAHRREGAAEEVLQRVWTAQHGVACRGVNWERHSLQELLTVAACVGARPLAAICCLLAEDYRGWSGAVSRHCFHSMFYSPGRHTVLGAPGCLRCRGHRAELL